MNDDPDMRVLSLGAGRQSTALALLSAEGALPKLDACIFADTGWEPKRVYDHLDRLEREVLKPANIPLYRVSGGNLRDDVLNPNKMRSIPAHTLGPLYHVIAVDDWVPCPDETCGWRKLRIGSDQTRTATTSGDGLFDYTPPTPKPVELPAGMSMRPGDDTLFECIAEMPPGATLNQIEAIADEDTSWADSAEIVAGNLRKVGLDQLPEPHELCNSTGRIITRYHLEPRRDKGMLNRRCTQLYKLNPILGQVRLLLGAKVGEARPCQHCDGTGERIAPWRAKLGDYTTGPCSVCDGEGSLSRIGPAPTGLWAEQWIGFSTDEISRVSGKGDTRYSKSRYPLLELDMSVTQCVAYLKAKGWPGAEKSACIGCPFHGNAAWRKMRDTCACGHHRDSHTLDVDGHLRCSQKLPHYRWATVGATCGCEGFDAVDWRRAVEFDRDYRHGPGMLHERYLHISRKPLDLAPIDIVRPSERLLPTLADIDFEERMERGDPDGCSPWGCRSGEAVTF